MDSRRCGMTVLTRTFCVKTIPRQNTSDAIDAPSGDDNNVNVVKLMTFISRCQYNAIILCYAQLLKILVTSTDTLWFVEY